MTSRPLLKPGFTSFIEGSRKCSFKVRTPKLKNLVSIHLVPIAHAAILPFYENLMTDLDQMRLVAQMNSDDNADLYTFDGHTAYHKHQQAELNKDEKDLLSTKRFVVVVEGASETVAERQMESEELALIQRHVKMTMAADDLSKQGMPTDILQESAQFVERYSNAVQSGMLYSEDHLRSICQMYSLPFPLPNELVLQDTFFRPRLAFRHGDCIVNGDIVVEKMQDPTIATTNAAAFHHLREFHCFETVKQLVKECDTNDMSLLNISSSSSDSEKKNFSNLPTEEEDEISQRHIAVLWGHYHCPKLLKLFQGAQKGDSGENIFDFVRKTTSSKNDDDDGVCTWSDEVRNYGWSKEMVKEYYNIDH